MCSLLLASLDNEVFEVRRRGPSCSFFGLIPTPTTDWVPLGFSQGVLRKQLTWKSPCQVQGASPGLSLGALVVASEDWGSVKPGGGAWLLGDDRDEQKENVTQKKSVGQCEFKTWPVTS